MTEQRLPSFSHVVPAIRIHCGEDCLRQLPAELDRLGAKRAVIFCGGSIGASLELKQVIAALGARHAGTFAGVRSHSPLPAVLQGAAALRTFEADAVIAVGGGSTVVSARASSIALAEGDNLHELCTQFPASKPPFSPKLSRPKLPQLVIPTTPTSAYGKAGTAVRDPVAGRRLTLFDPKTRAQALFLHPAMALTAPRELVLDAALQAFASAVQGLESRKHESLADALLMHALRLSVQHLPNIDGPDAASARLELMQAAFLAGQGTDYAPTGIAASLTHSIGARFGVANGGCNALLLPSTLGFNSKVTLDRMPLIAEALGAGRLSNGAEALQAASDAIRNLLAAIRAPQRLRDSGITRDSLQELAGDAMQDWFLHLNPRKVTSPDELLGVLEAAW